MVDQRELYTFIFMNIFIDKITKKSSQFNTIGLIVGYSGKRKKGCIFKSENVKIT